MRNAVSGVRSRGEEVAVKLLSYKRSQVLSKSRNPIRKSKLWMLVKKREQLQWASKSGSALSDSRRSGAKA